MGDVEGLADGVGGQGADDGLIDGGEGTAVGEAAAQVFYESADGADDRIALDVVAEADGGSDGGTRVVEDAGRNVRRQQLDGGGIEIDHRQQHVRRAARSGDDEVEAVGGAGTALAQGTFLGADGDAERDRQRHHANKENGGEGIAAEVGPDDRQRVHAGTPERMEAGWP